MDQDSTTPQNKLHNTRYSKFKTVNFFNKLTKMTTQHFVVEPQSADITLNRTGSKTSTTVRCF